METITRQEHIMAAIDFLRNPNLDSPLKEKLQFLKDKGLSEMELDEALNLALSCRQSTTRGRWNFFIVFSMCILGFRLYKAYLEWKLTSKGGDDHANKTEREQTQSISRASNNIKSRSETIDVMSISEIAQRMSELKKLIEYQGSKLTDEMQSLKKLLVSPEKFVSPPIIPAWQLKDSGDEVDESAKELDENK